LTKPTFLVDYLKVSSGYVTLGTQLLTRPASSSGPPDEVPGRDGTLLAVVPIPGTGTSLAIVGYAIATAGQAEGAQARGVTAAWPEGTAADPQPSARRSADSGLVLDHAQRRVWAGGNEIPLTFQEFELLAFLGSHPATVFSRADLIEQVWRRNPGRDPRAVARDSRTVDVHISRVRQKLGPRYGQCLVTEYRVGYQFRPLPE
jgi:Transcriptional regulatory protein, C terminal